MTAPFRYTPKPGKQRQCLWCHAGIAETRPVFLVTDYGGRILGPFHAGCAERLKMQAAKQPDTNWLKGAAEYGTWPTVREETLPE